MLFQLSYLANIVTLFPCLMRFFSNTAAGWTIYFSCSQMWSWTPTLSTKCHKVRKMQSHTGAQTWDLQTTIAMLFRLSGHPCHTSLSERWDSFLETKLTWQNGAKSRLFIMMTYLWNIKLSLIALLMDFQMKMSYIFLMFKTDFGCL